MKFIFGEVPFCRLRRTDEQTIEWDNNFRDDGNLMLLCCERNVDVREYRTVLENCVEYRNRVRAIVTNDR